MSFENSHIDIAPDSLYSGILDLQHGAVSDFDFIFLETQLLSNGSNYKLTVTDFRFDGTSTGLDSYGVYKIDGPNQQIGSSFFSNYEYLGASFEFSEADSYALAFQSNDPGLVNYQFDLTLVSDPDPDPDLSLVLNTKLENSLALPVGESNFDIKTLTGDRIGVLWQTKGCDASLRKQILVDNPAFLYGF